MAVLKWIVPGSAVVVTAIAVVALAARREAPSRAAVPADTLEKFPIWAPVAAGDVKSSSAEFVESDRVRLSLNTLGTNDASVKFIGLRNPRAISLSRRVSFGARLEWTDYPNAAYMSAGLVLSPEVTQGNPLEGPDWIKIQVVGVPPSRRARLLIAHRSGGLERNLFTDGWPEDREGRDISSIELEVALEEGRCGVARDGVPVYESGAPLFRFPVAHLYLLMSSHSNYPERSVHFSRLRLPP